MNCFTDDTFAPGLLEADPGLSDYDRDAASLEILAMQEEETGRPASPIPFVLTPEAWELAACRTILRYIVGELVKVNDARGMDFTGLIRRGKTVLRAVSYVPAPKVAPPLLSPLKDWQIYRRLHTEEEASPVSEAEARADVRHTDLYPFSWLGFLFGGYPVITERGVYGLSARLCEECKPEVLP